MPPPPNRRRVAAGAAVLVTAVLAGLVPAAATDAAPAPSLGVVRAKLADAIADEKRALQLLQKRPPRTQTALIVLKRSLEQLREISSFEPLPQGVHHAIAMAIRNDRDALIHYVPPGHPLGPDKIEAALKQKALAMKLLAPAPAAFALEANATHAYGDGEANVCVFVWTMPPQPPLNGAISLMGPSGADKIWFTSLGGGARKRVIFVVTDLDAGYTATVTLGGTTTKAFTRLGLGGSGETREGPYACPAPAA